MKIRSLVTLRRAARLASCSAAPLRLPPEAVVAAPAPAPAPAPTYTNGGTVSGIATSTSVVLQNNGGNSLAVNANGAFTFTSVLNNGVGDSASVLTQPVNQI